MTAGIAMLAVRLGFMLGIYRSRRSGSKDHGAVAAIVAGTLGLLAFVLALSYGTAAANFERRRQLVVDEASAIGSSYATAGLLPEPQGTEIRDILREYVSIRANGWQTDKLPSVIARSEELQDRIWSELAAVNENPTTLVNIKVLFAQTLNQLTDVHAKRAAEASHHVLPTEWITLYFVAVMAMLAVGYQHGLNGKYDLPVVLIVVIAFSVTLWLLADFDRPLTGTLKVSQQPMIELEQKLASPGN